MHEQQTVTNDGRPHPFTLRATINAYQCQVCGRAHVEGSGQYAAHLEQAATLAGALLLVQVERRLFFRQRCN